MNKREFLHKMIDAICDIEETSNKRVSLFYFGSTPSVSFDIKKNKEDYTTNLASFHGYNLDKFDLGKMYEAFQKAALIEDGPVEKVLEFRITESRAKELGLLNENEPA